MTATPHDPAPTRGLTVDQVTTLMRPLMPSRVATRQSFDGGRKELSYVEAWDIKAHLTRIFGFCNWDAETVEYHFMGEHQYQSTPKDKPPADMIEIVYSARVRLTIRDQYGNALATYSEAAAGSATAKASTGDRGGLHDNAVKQAESDALKRCAINLGTQFGLSLYDNGNLADVVRKLVVAPPNYAPSAPPAEAQAAIANTTGATA